MRNVQSQQQDRKDMLFGVYQAVNGVYPEFRGGMNTFMTMLGKKCKRKELLEYLKKKIKNIFQRQLIRFF